MSSSNTALEKTNDYAEGSVEKDIINVLTSESNHTVTSLEKRIGSHDVITIALSLKDLRALKIVTKVGISYSLTDEYRKRNGLAKPEKILEIQMAVPIAKVTKPLGNARQKTELKEKPLRTYELNMLHQARRNAEAFLAKAGLSVKLYRGSLAGRVAMAAWMWNHVHPERHLKSRSIAEAAGVEEVGLVHRTLRELAIRHIVTRNDDGDIATYQWSGFMPYPFMWSNPSDFDIVKIKPVKFDPSFEYRQDLKKEFEALDPLEVKLIESYGILLTNVSKN